MDGSGLVLLRQGLVCAESLVMSAARLRERCFRRGNGAGLGWAGLCLPSVVFYFIFSPSAKLCYASWVGG